MNDDIKFIKLIENEVMSVGNVSRFADASFTENLQAVFGRDPVNPGIRVQQDENSRITINLQIIVCFGANIPQLCYDIQTRVKNDLEKVTGLEIKAVNITIEGIDEI